MANVAKPDTVAVLSKAGEVRKVEGAALPLFTDHDLSALHSTRPTLRKVDGKTVCAAPVEGGQTLMHIYHRVPDGVPLTDLARMVTAAANTVPAKPERAAPVAENRFWDAYRAALQSRPARRVQAFLHELRDNGFARGAVAVEMASGRIRKVSYSDPQYAGARDELVLVVERALQDAGGETALDAALIAGKLGGKTLDLALPASGGDGLVLAVLDADADGVATLRTYRDVLDTLLHRPWLRRALRPSVAKAVGLVLAAALCVYLALPAPLYVSGTATARASDSIVKALPFPAFLDRSLVRPGDRVTAGQVLVRLRSPELEDAAEQERLNRNLEVINAQDALDQGDVAAYQLAEERRRISELRLAQLEGRIAQLTITAASDAVVTAALSNSETGSFLGTGTPLVTVRATGSFDLNIDLSPADAARVAAGQGGVVYFRGLGSRTYTFETRTGPVQVADPETGQISLQARARILDPDQSRLLVGLNGFAKVEIDRAARIVGLLRPASSFIRFTLWKRLGLDI